MNDSISHVVGAPAPIQIGQKTYTASPLDLFNLGEIEQAFRMRILSAVMCAPAPSELERNRMYKIAVRETMEVTFNSPEVQDFLKSPTGALELILCSLKPNHPGLDARALAVEFRGRIPELERVVTTITAISGFADAEGGASGKDASFSQGNGAADGAGAGGTLRLDTAAVGPAHAAAG